MQTDKIFDDVYVGQQGTILDSEKKSGVKEFLKNPITEDDLEKYGSSKPKRIIIRASILHGKN